MDDDRQIFHLAHGGRHGGSDAVLSLQPDLGFANFSMLPAYTASTCPLGPSTQSHYITLAWAYLRQIQISGELKAMGIARRPEVQCCVYLRCRNIKEPALVGCDSSNFNYRYTARVLLTAEFGEGNR